MKSPSILWVSAEASADLHGSRVIKMLKSHHPHLTIKGVGGRFCQEAGMDVLYTAREMAVMGLVEVLSKYFFFRKVLHHLIRWAREEHPSVACLMDYPGFNFPLMKKLHALGIPVVYYICPQVWAWGKKRLQTLGAYAHTRIVIFPFEKEFFQENGVEAHYWGHPLVETIPPPRDLPQGDVLALLPGSRKQEIQRHLPLMLALAQPMASRFTIRILPSPTVEEEYYHPFIKKFPGISVELRSSWENIHAALVSSGTATLECALRGIPAVVMYRMNNLSYLLLRPFVKTPFISIVNILANQSIFPEFLQCQGKNEELKEAWEKSIDDEAYRQALFVQTQTIRSILGDQAVTPRVADLLGSFLS